MSNMFIRICRILFLVFLTSIFPRVLLAQKKSNIVGQLQSVIGIDVLPRGLEPKVIESERFLLEIWDPVVEPIAVNVRKWAISSRVGEPLRTGEPVFFKFTDEEAGVSFTGYVAWDFTQHIDFSYPLIDGRNFEILPDYQITSCSISDPNRTGIRGSGYSIADSLIEPSFILLDFLNNENYANNISIQPLEPIQEVCFSCGESPCHESDHGEVDKAFG